VSINLPAITLPDGSTLNLAWTAAPAVTPPPPPPPVVGPIPTNPAPTTVVAGTSSFTLSGVNPTNTAFPGGRGPNQLVAYQYPLTVTSTNQWGAELQLKSDGTVVAINDRQLTGSTTGTAILPNGSVLSGHGTARDWLLTLKVGSVVTFGTPVVTTPPPSTGATMAVYFQLGVDSASQIPAGTTQLRLAFGTGDPPRLTANAPDLTAFRATGGKVLLSLGGEGGPITQSDHVGIITAVSSISAAVGGLDGLDWDLEAVGLSVSDVVAISQALTTAHPGWITSFCPPGGPPVAPAIQAAAQLAAAGCTVQWAQQFYGATVSASAAAYQCKLAVSGGVPASSVLVGIMIGSDSQTWSVSTATANVASIRAAVPGIGGAVWWHAGISGTSTSVAAVKALFG
jgi:hypothetical protein